MIFWIYGWLKNPAIWLAENILAHMQELKLSQIWNGCRNAANNINFHYRINSVRINDKIFSINSKNPVFGTFLVCFPNFGGKIFFSGKSGSVTHNFIWSSSKCQNLEKTIQFKDTIPRKCLDRRLDGRTDGKMERWTDPIS